MKNEVAGAKITRANDARHQGAIVGRDRVCVFCGETRPEYLCAHHVITRGVKPIRYDLRNSVTVCNNPRRRFVKVLRHIDTGGWVDAPCHVLAECHSAAFILGAIDYFKQLGYFKDEAQYYEFTRCARTSQPLPGGVWLSWR